MAKLKWGNTDITWADANQFWSLIEELETEVLVTGVGAEARKKRLEQYLDKKEKKEKLIHLICRIKGEKVYDENKQVTEDVVLTVDDVEMVVNEVKQKLGKIMVETKSGI